MRLATLTLAVALTVIPVAACGDEDDPVVSPAEPGTDPAPGPGAGGVEEIEPEPGVAENVRSRPFDRAEISEDGAAVDVFYFGGITECYVLDRIELVRPDPATVRLTLFEGNRPGANTCIEIAVSYVTTVELDEPLVAGGTVVDGSDGQVKS